MAKILVVEDEPDLNALVSDQLRQEGHEVTQAFDGVSGLEAVETGAHDLVILDWMLPKLDGLAVCRRIRQSHLVPVLMLTARGEEADVVLALEVGADDYITKPFRLRELMARIHALLRRESRTRPGANEKPDAEDEAQTIVSGPLMLQPVMRTARLDGHDLDLTPTEFALLELFMSHVGRAFSREYLLERIWPSEYEVTDRTVDTHVQRLRRKLGPQAESIRTVWGIGYRFQPND